MACTVASRITNFLELELTKIPDRGVEDGRRGHNSRGSQQCAIVRATCKYSLLTLPFFPGLAIVTEMLQRSQAAQGLQWRVAPRIGAALTEIPERNDVQWVPCSRD